MKNDQSVLFDLYKSREQMYRFLSRLYLLEVDETLFEALKEMKFPKEAADEELTEGYACMQGYIQDAAARAQKEGGLTEVLDELAVDYARIFLSAGVAQGKAAFPFESVYTSRQHLMMQESRNDVIALYAEKGLTPGKDMYRVPEDHLGLLLEYMALLCAEACGEDGGIQETSVAEQKEFLEQHLINWVFAFTADVMAYASTDFYRGLGKLTKGFLSLERSLFAEE